MIPTNAVYHIRSKNHLGQWVAYNFATLDEATESALGISDDVYFAPHLIRPDWADHLLNSVTQSGNELCVSNKAVEKYQFIIFDVDPTRPPKAAATEEQRAHAHDVAQRVAAFIREQWGVTPHLWTSGNGYYVLVNTDIPASCYPLVKAVTHYVADRFSTEHATIDKSVSKPGQIIRFPDTWNRKGSDPLLHRKCEILETGSGTVNEEQLRALVPDAPTQTFDDEPPRSDVWFAESVKHFRQLLEDNQVQHTEKEKPVDGQPAVFFELGVCPLKDHTPTQVGGPYITVSQARGVYGGCHHDECKTKGNKLPQLLEKIDPKYKQRIDREYVQGLDAVDNPRRIADIVREQTALVRKGDVFFDFADGIYRQLDRTDVAALIENVSRRTFVNHARYRRDRGAESKTIPVTSRLVNDVRLALAATVKPVSGEPPCRVDTGEPLTDRLFFANGHIAIDDALAGRDHLDPYTAEEFITHKLNVDYRPDPLEPKLWLQTLDEIFPDDYQSIRLLRQWFGYCLTQDTSQHKILVMLGQTRAGKSLCANILTELVGTHNVASSFLPALGSKWGLDGLIGKSLLTVPEARNSEFSRGATADVLKAISGGDAVRVERRYEHSITTVLPIKIVIVSNNQLEFDDISGTIFNRFLTLHFQQSFFGREDTRRFEKLKRELPGIMRWALEGLRDLRQFGFVEPETGKQLRREMETQNNPGLAFADECFVRDMDSIEPTSKVWGHFVDWCQSRDIIPPSRTQFNAQLKTKGIQTAIKTKARTMHYVGVRLYEEEHAIRQT